MGELIKSLVRDKASAMGKPPELSKCWRVSAAPGIRDCMLLGEHLPPSWACSAPLASPHCRAGHLHAVSRSLDNTFTVTCRNILSYPWRGMTCRRQRRETSRKDGGTGMVGAPPHPGGPSPRHYLTWKNKSHILPPGAGWRQ